MSSQLATTLQTHHFAHYRIEPHEVSVDEDRRYPVLEGSFGEGSFAGRLYGFHKVTVKRLDPTKLILTKDTARLLYSIRHETIAAFIGGCLSQKDNDTLSTLVIEHVHDNLHDLLHNRREALDVPDMIDYSGDILAALNYLSSKGLVHGNLKASNVLLGHGNRAKLTDLRPDKPNYYSAYAPIECLSNLYTIKSDLFSFGVILIEMGCQKRPVSDAKRWETLEQHLKLAAAHGVCLAELMTQCTSEHPEDRPSPLAAFESLRQIRGNDRCYPPSARSGPLQGMSAAARLFIDKLGEEKCAEKDILLHKANSKLHSEQLRWSIEAAKVDRARDDLHGLEKRHTELCASLDVALDRQRQLEIELEQARLLDQQKSDYIAALTNQQEQSSKAVRDLEDWQAKQLIQAEVASKEAVFMRQRIALFEKNLLASKERERQQEGENREFEDNLKAEIERSDDLEVRFEQALTGWRKETEAMKEQRAKYWKIKMLYVIMAKKREALGEANVVLRQRLAEYDNLPSAGEISDTLGKLDMKIAKQLEDIDRLLEQHRQLEDRYEQLRRAHERLQQDMDEQQAEKMRLEGELGDLKKVSAQFKRDSKNMKDTLRAEHDRYSLLSEEKSRLEHQLAETSTDLKYAKRAVRQLEVRITQMQMKEAGLDASEIAEREASDKAALEAEEAVGAAEEEKGSPDKEKKATKLKQLLHNAHSQMKSIAAMDSTQEDFTAIRAANRDRQRDLEAKRLVKEAADTGGVASLCDLLKDLCTKEEMVSWRCCRALRELLVAAAAEGSTADEMRKTCFSHRCDESVLEALKKHTAHEMVQGQGLRLLGTLAYGNDHVRRRVGELGGMRHVVETMEFYADDTTILLHASTAITNLAHNSVDNRNRFIEASGVGVLVSLMERHMSSAKLQRQACWTILTLAGSDEASRHLAQEGTISAVLNAMLSHGGDGGVQQFGCWAVANIALAGEDIRRKIRKAGFTEACRIAMENPAHRGDEEVLRHARHALGVLGGEKSMLSDR